jgi:hypothetical protein
MTWKYCTWDAPEAAGGSIIAASPPAFRTTTQTRHYRPVPTDHEENAMSKGMDQKKTEKKKPEKSLKEKRAAKKEKKGK